MFDSDSHDDRYVLLGELVGFDWNRDPITLAHNLIRIGHSLPVEKSAPFFLEHQGGLKMYKYMDELGKIEWLQIPIAEADQLSMFPDESDDLVGGVSFEECLSVMGRKLLQEHKSFSFDVTGSTAGMEATRELSFDLGEYQLILVLVSTSIDMMGWIELRVWFN